MNFLGNTNDFKKTTIENGKPKDQGFPDETHNIAQGLREIYSRVKDIPTTTSVNVSSITDLLGTKGDLPGGANDIAQGLREIYNKVKDIPTTTPTVNLSSVTDVLGTIPDNGHDFCGLPENDRNVVNGLDAIYKIVKNIPNVEKLKDSITSSRSSIQNVISGIGAGNTDMKNIRANLQKIVDDLTSTLP